ncbi:CDP-alcohol phosphatidyltransferase family protein, partial [Chloroflexota bacterium]
MKNNNTSDKQGTVKKLFEVRKLIAYNLTRPFISLLARTPLTPNIISLFGLLTTIGAAVLIINGHLLAAGFVVIFAGFFDVLDGALARATDRTTKFGAFLDSTFDRLTEAILLLGILILVIEDSQAFSIVLVYLAFVGGMLVSYIRSRAEALGLDCQIGLCTRTERVVVLALGLLLDQIIIALVIIV